MTLKVGILTVSDRVSAGQMEDLGGPAVEGALETLDCETAAQRVVPDDRETIAGVIREWADERRLDVIFTTGGTGLGPRDVTPEATLDVCNREVPGIAEAMRSAGLEQTVHAMLSRATAAVRTNTLVINLPGSPRGAAEGVAIVAPVLAHAIATIQGGKH
jgi:molybdopterin adenylyltransferase